MDATSTALLAGLGGAVLGSLITGGLTLHAAKRRIDAERAATQRRERREAYSELLAYGGLLGQWAHVLHLTMKTRSGIKEGLDVATGKRKPLDPIELHSEMRADLEPLYRAWSSVWTVGTQEAITAANALVTRAADVVNVAASRGQARGAFFRGITGEKWTHQQLSEWREQEHQLALARREFTKVARSELGLEVAEVFTAEESTPG